MGMILAGTLLLLIGFSQNNVKATAWIVGGFVWIAAGYLLHNLTRANEKKTESPDQNRE